MLIRPTTPTCFLPSAFVCSEFYNDILSFYFQIISFIFHSIQQLENRGKMLFLGDTDKSCQAIIGLQGVILEANEQIRIFQRLFVGVTVQVREHRL